MDQYPELTFIVALLGIILVPGKASIVILAVVQKNIFIAASTRSCQVYPSEYAYRDDSVTRAESTSANCMRYSENLQGLPAGTFSKDYIHCDGTQLKLADSDLGREQYNRSNYYVLKAGSDGRLLFIFPTRVSLTTITLHYYSDSV